MEPVAKAVMGMPAVFVDVGHRGGRNDPGGVWRPAEHVSAIKIVWHFRASRGQAASQLLETPGARPEGLPQGSYRYSRAAATSSCPTWLIRGQKLTSSTSPRARLVANCLML